MTTTVSPLGIRSAAPPRAALVTLAAAGPLAIAVLRGVLPYDTVDDAATVAAKVAAHPGTQAAVLGLTWLALLTLPLGIAITGAAAARHRRVLGGVAAAVAWVGFLSIFAAVGADTIAFTGATAGVPTGTVTAMIGALDASAATSLPAIVFVAGHILGAVLLGVALWGAVPRWAAVALIASQPLHLVFAVVVVNHPLDAVAWALTGVGFAAAAARSGR